MTKHFTANYSAKNGRSGQMQFSRVNVSEDETLAADDVDRPIAAKRR